MDQDRQSRWRPTIQQVLWSVGIVVALVLAIIIVLGYVLEWEWTGLVKDKAYTKRTLWDWLQLLIIPAVLAGVGLWFNRQQREHELQTADRRAQDEALQAYLDQMSAMMIPKKDQPSLSDKEPPDSLKTVARARTLTLLPRLDGSGKGRVVRFLHESNLIRIGVRDEQGKVTQVKVVDLSGANLRDAHLFINLHGVALDGVFLERADLRSANLEYADLSDSKLSGANLSNANLVYANLWHANLSDANLSDAVPGDANLSDADLSNANLSGAHMPNADLSRANLSGANLSGANLSGANLWGAALPNANLSGADLWGANLRANGLTEEQLDQANTLYDATMPDERVLKGPENPNGPTFTEWRKSRGRGEAAENSSP